MAENRKYKIIVSDRAKQMLGTHIRFMAQVIAWKGEAKGRGDGHVKTGGRIYIDCSDQSLPVFYV